MDRVGIMAAYCDLLCVCAWCVCVCVVCVVWCVWCVCVCVVCVCGVVCVVCVCGVCVVCGVCGVCVCVCVCVWSCTFVFAHVFFGSRSVRHKDTFSVIIYLLLSLAFHICFPTQIPTEYGQKIYHFFHIRTVRLDDIQVLFIHQLMHY